MCRSFTQFWLVSDGSNVIVSPVFKRLLTLRGFHYVATRFCGSTVRQWAFDEMYRSGKWNFTESENALSSVVEQYARNGHILMVGCGTATILSKLRPDSFQSVRGIDISGEALARASKYRNEKIDFEVADILEFKCPRKYDVILFSESFNYIPESQQVELLNRLCGDLTPGGCLVVTLSNPDRYRDIIERIKKNFHCLKAENFAGSKRYLLVFDK
jgi:SAM-dependent methyltransferase